MKTVSQNSQDFGLFWTKDITLPRITSQQIMGFVFVFLLLRVFKYANNHKPECHLLLGSGFMTNMEVCLVVPHSREIRDGGKDFLYFHFYKNFSKFVNISFLCFLVLGFQSAFEHLGQ